MFESKFEIERAWQGGPLRKVGTGNGSPSKYVCEACERSSMGVYHTKQGLWLCQACKNGVTGPENDAVGVILGVSEPRDEDLPVLQAAQA